MIAASASRCITIGSPMKTILCYGDSNTHGFNAHTQDRFSIDERWTGVLAQELGAAYHVVEEGLNGRTTVWNDPVEGRMSGKDYLVPCLASHHPIDLVVLMLGTNDLKKRFAVSVFDIAYSVGMLVNIIQTSGAGPDYSAPQVLLISPPVVGKLSAYAEMFGDDVQARSKQFAKHYRLIADQYRCHFLDAAQVIVSGDVDGVHWEADQHRKLGRVVAARVKEIFA